MDNEQRSASRKRADNRVQEFVWAFGSQAEEEIERQIGCQIEQLKKTGDVEYLLHGRWSHMEELDQDEWLEHLEEHLKEIVNISGKDEKNLAIRLEKHRQEVHDRIAREHPELAERFRERRRSRSLKMRASLGTMRTMQSSARCSMPEAAGRKCAPTSNARRAA